VDETGKGGGKTCFRSRLGVQKRTLLASDGRDISKKGKGPNRSCEIKTHSGK